MRPGTRTENCNAAPLCAAARTTLSQRCCVIKTRPVASPHVQLGHQAANCTSGTVNWRQIYGDNAFILRPPTFWSEELAAKKKRQADLTELEKRAREYAKVGPAAKTACEGTLRPCLHTHQSALHASFSCIPRQCTAQPKLLHSRSLQCCTRRCTGLQCCPSASLRQDTE